MTKRGGTTRTVTMRGGTTRAVLRARHAAWPAPARATGMPAPGEAARGIRVTDRALTRDGVPFVPVSGEIHFTRVPRHRWTERLRQMRAGGITVASTYVFWNHHAPEHAVADFTGDRDLGAFVDACAQAGLDLVLRIGPWVHGEARNGGFPDWVQDAPVAHRTDDPAYLDLVREWFAQIAAALGGRAQPGGPIIAIQLENELYDRPEHLLTLQRLAREAGMAAPLWTATAWGGADLPGGGAVFPLFGGYADGFWADPEDEWDPSFRAHFLPSHEWDDPGVGADVRAHQGFDAPVAATASLRGFPPATCELGAGMATAYHRRPVLDPLDVAALAHTKIGNGSAWQGYYMYAGGRNPGPGLQESHASGYPNDLPEYGYDFHAPLGQAGSSAASAALLRDQHAFLAAFGDLLGGMTSSLPDHRPSGPDDRSTLRWALRSDDRSGFIVISHHRPYAQVEAICSVRLQVDLPAGQTVLPAVDILPGTLARWPIGLEVAAQRIDWATASALTLLPGARPTIVLRETCGVPPMISVDGVVHRLAVPAHDAPRPVRMPTFDVLLVGAQTPVWVREGGPGRRLLRSDADLAEDGSGRVWARGSGAVEVYDPEAGAWQVLRAARPAPRAQALVPSEKRPARPVPTGYGMRGARHSAPGADAFDAHAAVFALPVPAWATDPDADAVLEIDWHGDVGQLRRNGVTVDDRFWDGTGWTVSLVDAQIAAGDRVSLHVLPLAADATIALGTAAISRRAEGTAAIPEATVRARGPWEEVPLAR